jgi:hypothetical protein
MARDGIEAATERRFLRFAGKLWETGEFEPGVGWETARIARRPRPTPGYRLQLLDETGGVLVEAGVKLLGGGECRSRGTDSVTRQRVVGYVPLHGKARSLAFARDGRLLYGVKLAARATRIALTSLDLDTSGRLHVSWDANHDRRLWFNVVVLDAERRAMPVVRELSDTKLVFPTDGLPGGRGCSIAVLATDGLRSTMVESRRFDLAEQPPRIAIVPPRDGETLPPGEIVARGQRLAAAGPLEPGGHEIELVFIRDGEIVARDAVRLRVPERSTEQERWRAVSSSIRSTNRG